MPLTQDPQRLAWGVLLLAFAIFCLICAGVGIGVNYFLFDSRVPLNVALVMARGAAEIVEPVVGLPRSEMSSARVTSGAQVRTNLQSQGTLTIRDPNSGGIVAMATLMSGASFDLDNALGPRFDWSVGGYQINLDQVRGDLDVFIPAQTQRDLTILLRSSDGVLTYLNGAGYYQVSSRSEQVRVFNRTGVAHLIPPEAHEGARSIPAGGIGIAYAGENRVELSAGLIDVLRNSRFQELNPRVSSGPTQELLTGWFCGSDMSDDPRGTYRSQMLEGRMTLKFERYGGATSHGSTSCFQTLGQTGYDLAANNVNYLELSTTFYITYQSLPACGIDGSECPLMLRMDYIDERGTARRWFHGFYSRNDTQLDFPLSCSSCTREHDAINPQTWYTFNTGNLLALFPPDQRPRAIINIWFYASGHQYDVNISEMALLAGQSPADESSAER